MTSPRSLRLRVATSTRPSSPSPPRQPVLAMSPGAFGRNVKFTGHARMHFIAVQGPLACPARRFLLTGHGDRPPRGLQATLLCPVNFGLDLASVFDCRRRRIPRLHPRVSYHQKHPVFVVFYIYLIDLQADNVLYDLFASFLICIYLTTNKTYTP